MLTTTDLGTPVPGPPRPAGAGEMPPVVSDPRLLTLLQALADEKRLRILEALTGGEACVCELQDTLELGQSLLSHHLRVLREAGLVHDRKEGRWIHYSVVPDVLGEVEARLAALRVPSSLPSGAGGGKEADAPAMPRPGRGARCAP